MQPEQTSNALDHESAMSGGGAAEIADDRLADDTPQTAVPAVTIDTMPASAPSATDKGVGQLLSIFKIAAEDQADVHRDLNERMDRLEKFEDVRSLRESVRELLDVVTGLAGEMDRRISRAEHQITTVAKAVEALVGNFSSATDDLKHLNLSAHEKLVTLHELLNSTEVRIDQAEIAIAGSREGDSKSLAALGVLSKSLQSFDDRLSQEQTQSEQLEGRLGLAESRLANFAGVETRIEALTTRVAELGTIEKSLTELREGSELVSADMSTLQTRVAQAEIGIKASAEQNQSLAKLHASLAQTYAPKAD